MRTFAVETADTVVPIAVQRYQLALQGRHAFARWAGQTMRVAHSVVEAERGRLVDLRGQYYATITLDARGRLLGDSLYRELERAIAPGSGLNLPQDTAQPVLACPLLSGDGVWKPGLRLYRALLVATLADFPATSPRLGVPDHELPRCA